MAPRNNSIIGLKQVHVKAIEECRNGIVWMHAVYKGPWFCGHCESRKVHSHGQFIRRLKHTRCDNQLVNIELQVWKLNCLSCGRRSHQRLPNVRPRKRSSESFRLEVFEAHNGGQSQKQLTRSHGVSTSTVERWYWDFTKSRLKEMSGRSCPRILGIDEHFFTRKKGYATTLVDLGNHKVFDVVLGRSESSLAGYLKRIKGRDRVKVVVMDLSETYRSIIKKYFPNAMIVSDRFHVVRLVQHHFQKLWSQIDPVGRRNRGLLSLFRRDRSKMSEIQQGYLQKYFKEFPAMGAVDELQQRLLKLFRTKGIGKEEARRLIPELLECLKLLKESGLEGLKTLGKTLESWLEPVARMWRFRKTNSITEGFHTKMEMLSRRAYGFRNFQNYRIRVIVHCGWDGLINRVDLRI